MPSYLESKVQTTGSTRVLIINTRYLVFLIGLIGAALFTPANVVSPNVSMNWSSRGSRDSAPLVNRLEAVILDSFFRLNIAQQEVFPLHLLQDELMIIDAVRMSMLVQ